MAPVDAAASGGTKLDQGKPRVSNLPPELILILAKMTEDEEVRLGLGLIPPEMFEAIARRLAIGARKYAARNWEKGLDWNRCYDALQRHLLAFWSGEDIDIETGQPHTWGVLANIAFLVTFEAREIGNDNRSKFEER